MVWPDPSDPGRSADAPLSDASPSLLRESKIPLEHLATLLARNRASSPTSDPALERIAEQACLATPATAAAIALKEGEDFICRAACGANAPPLGARLRVDFGLTGLCIRECAVQQCDDAEADSRVDAVACRNLGVRSLLVVPLLQGTRIVGIFEAFSPEAHALSSRDAETLLVLAERVVDRIAPKESSSPASSTLRFPVAVAGTEAAEPLTAEPEIAQISTSGQTSESSGLAAILPSQEGTASDASGAESEEAELISPQEPTRSDSSIQPAALPQGFSSGPLFRTNLDSRPVRDWTSTALVVLVVILSVILGWMLGRVSWMHRDLVRSFRSESQASEPPVAPKAQPASAPAAPVTVEPAATKSDKTQPVSPATPAKTRKAAVTPATPAGGLRVYQDGKVIFQLQSPPNASGAGPQEVESPAPTLPAPVKTSIALPPDQAGEFLVHRVEPVYPDLARQNHIQGAVVFEVWVGENGWIQQLHVLSGNHELVNAAANAVRAWRFRPYAPQGKPVEFTTQITVNFVLQENP